MPQVRARVRSILSARTHGWSHDKSARATDLLAWLNGSGGGGKNFPFHPSQAYHSWLLGRLIELRMHSQGFLQNVLWFHGKMLKQHQYRIVLLRKHFANFWHQGHNSKISIWNLTADMSKNDLYSTFVSIFEYLCFFAWKGL